MRQLIYISTPHDGILPADLNAILMASVRNNALAGVTGILLNDGRRFLQVLEGEQADVDTTLSIIRDDVRHYGLVVLKERDVANREFGNWAMASRGFDAGARDLGSQVDEIVKDVSDVTVRTLFSQFARREPVTG